MDGPSAPLKVLLVEDSAADAEMILRALRPLPRPIEHARVASADTLRVALAQFAPDVILSDFSMPGFSGQEALEIASAEASATPFMFISGEIGEERAIEALQRGASDYLLKDSLLRLPSAVRRALHRSRNQVQREQMEQALRESESRFRNIVETSQDWIWEIDPQGRHTYDNPATLHLLGYSAEEMQGKDALQFLHPDDQAEVQQQLPELMARKQGWHNWRLRWLHRDGSTRVLVSSASPILDAAGELTGFRGIDHDITEIEQQQLRIRHLSRLHAVLSALGSAVLRTGTRQGVLDEACRVAVEVGGFRLACIGYRAEDRSLRMISRHGDMSVIAALLKVGARAGEIDDPAQMSPGMRALSTDSMIVIPDMAFADAVPDWVRELMQEHRIGAQAVLPIGKPAWGVVALYADQPQVFDADELALFEQLAAEIDYAVEFTAKSERLEYLAYHNPVSGLFNRVGFYQRVEVMLDGAPLSVALVDVQRFEAINDSRGRAFGDKMLRQAGQRLRALLGKDALVAHLEAKTFAFVYRTAGTAQLEVERLETVIEAFEREPFDIDGEQIRIDLCGGLALSPDHGVDPEALEHAALAALDECHKRGLRVHVFDEELRGRAARRLALELELRHAIEHEEFELFYQPKFDAASQRLTGAEALLRWRHPQRGLVSPAEFIPLLEESALIVPVGHWVMAQALRTALAWRELQPGLRIAVNVSSRELRHRDFMDEVRVLLQPHADDQLVDVEVTESLLMDDIAGSILLLDSLRELGCKIAIDDFGTGYSSLNYLARLPADTLKIDQSFISVLTESPQTMSLVTNIINLAHSMSLTVVAEGVEDEGQANLLRLLRCDVLQGYLLGRPMPAAAFAEKFLGAEPVPLA